MKSFAAVLFGATIALAATASDPRYIHYEFLGKLDKRAAGRFVTRKKYTSAVFNGLAVELKAPEDVVDLASIPNVVSVRPVTIYPATKPFSLHVASGPDDPAVPPFGQSPHVMTGVDRVHEQGFTGKGIKIGIIDTGVDYTHPSLGGGFGPGCKIVGGYDLVGDAYIPGLVDPVPDDDPMDQCQGHGTHVAGIVGAAPGNEMNITGVAPDAALYAYRVIGCAGGVGEDVLIDALLRAHADGMDVITMSIGGASAWPDEPVSVVASRVAEQGTVVTMSGGNDGDYGPFFFGAPANGKDVIAVASVNNLARMYQTMTTNVEHAPIASSVPCMHGNIPLTRASQPYKISDPLEDLDGWPVDVPETPFPVDALTTDPMYNATACEPLGDDVPDLTGYAVVFRSARWPEVLVPGMCQVEDQIRNIAKKGADFFIIYDAAWEPYVGNIPNKEVLLRNIDDGIWLVNEFNKGTNLTVTFKQHGSGVDVPNPNGGLTSLFSSFGPTQDLLFKPALGAPGGNITSTYIVKKGSWAVASGTSLATPYMAGSAALLLQAKGKGSTAVGLPESHEPRPRPHTLAQQGAGLINVFNALNVKTEVSPAELLLNDTAHWKGVHRITIKNTGQYKQKYTLSHQPAGTATMHDIALYPVPVIDAAVAVHFSEKEVTLAPGASTAVTVNISPPKNVDPKTLPLVSGWINVRGSFGDRVQVSYLGVAGSMYAAETIISKNQVSWYHYNLPAIVPGDIGEDGAPIRQVGPRNYTRSWDSLPSLVFLLAQNSRRVFIDLIDPAMKVDATIPSVSRKRSVWPHWWKPGLPLEEAGGSFDDVPIKMRIYDLHDIMHISGGPLGPAYQIYLPPMVFGTDVPYGQYKILLRALRQFGDPALEKDYDVYVSEQIGIVESL
ncbi:subtilisin-like protein [Auricularia subglabra TFB-10046 SS5]|uniref:Subtilisin-like protein n=1 Tax=Auricularia subglabra (strain TFB-10046 / SS5) TaxID=717982 RepID=J0LH44_AURST|nr:subtilisin-like protein [Auricularia subglabra TFB-10046 SS5]